MESCVDWESQLGYEKTLYNVVEDYSEQPITHSADSHRDIITQSDSLCKSCLLGQCQTCVFSHQNNFAVGAPSMDMYADLLIPHSSMYQQNTKTMISYIEGDPVLCDLSHSSKSAEYVDGVYKNIDDVVFDDFIDEDNLLLGIPTEYVPKPSHFVTVETHYCEQVVPEIDFEFVLSSDDDLAHVGQLSDSIGENLSNFTIDYDISSHCQVPSELPSFPPEINFSSQSALFDDDDFGLVPQSSHTYGELSPLLLDESSQSWVPDHHSIFDQDPDILSDTSEEFDRPVDSCSVQDHTVPVWAIEE